MFGANIAVRGKFDKTATFEKDRRTYFFEVR